MLALSCTIKIEAEAYRLIGPNALQQEVEEAQARKYHIGFFHTVRNCLALGPLILTWFALYQASTNYQQDLKKYPNDLYEPFLKLWQYGFCNGFHRSRLITSSNHPTPNLTPPYNNKFGSPVAEIFP